MVVEYRFRADEDYYVTTCLRYRRQRWWYRWFYPAGVVAWIASAALIYASKGVLAGPSAWVFVFLLLGGALIFSARLNRVGFFYRRRIRKIPTLNDDWVIRLSEDGMSSRGNRGEGRLDWSGFSRARRFADGLLLFEGPQLFSWFPDSARAQPALPSDVDDLVRRHVSDYRDVGRRASFRRKNAS